MGTVFLLVDEARGRYLDLGKFCPDIFIDMCGRGPKCERTLAAIERECLDEDDEDMRDSLSKASCARLFAFLVSADWAVSLAADCWDTRPEYFECLRTLACVGDVRGKFQEGVCSTCGARGMLDPGDGGVCQQCEWADDDGDP